jgi:hypothetical protein
MGNPLTMKYQFLFTSLFIFSLSSLPAQACPAGNPQTTAYIRRENNRCEGIQSRDVVSGIYLISIVTRGITSYPNLLTLQIPRLGDSTPDIKLESLSKNYLLDNLTLKPSQGRFTFNLKPDVLNKAKVTPNTLRALAEVNSVYLPVIIGQPSKQYEFVFYTSHRSKFSTFEILHNSKVVYRNPRNNAQDGEIVFTWNGTKAPAGHYEIHVIAEQELIGRPSEKFERRFHFEHNPNWLK